MICCHNTFWVSSQGDTNLEGVFIIMTINHHMMFVNTYFANSYKNLWTVTYVG